MTHAAPAGVISLTGGAGSSMMAAGGSEVNGAGTGGGARAELLNPFRPQEWSRFRRGHTGAP